MLLVEHTWVRLSFDFKPNSRLTYNLVDAFPFLKNFPRWLPGLQFLEIGDRGRGLARDVVVGPYNEIQAQVARAFWLSRFH